MEKYTAKAVIMIVFFLIFLIVYEQRIALPHGKMLPGNIKLAGFVASNEMLPDRWVVSYSIFLLLYS